MNKDDFKRLKALFEDGGDISSLQWPDDYDGNPEAVWLHLSDGTAIKVVINA